MNNMLRAAATFAAIFALGAVTAPSADAAPRRARRAAAATDSGAAADTATTPPAVKTIADVAMGDKRFTTLVKLVTLADAAELLKQDKITVFAPTNDAFAKLPKAVTAALTKPEGKELLTKVLTYHVVAEVLPSATAPKDPTALPTVLAGADIKVTRKGKALMINDAKVVAADIKAGNGLIHAIDGVLVPEEVAKALAAAPAPSADTGAAPAADAAAADAKPAPAEAKPAPAKRSGRARR